MRRSGARLNGGAAGGWLVALCAFATIAPCSLPARAQPLAHRIPADAVFYAGWSGVERMPAGFGASHFKALLESSGAGRLMAETLPRAMGRLPRDRAAGQAIEAMARAAWRYPTAVYVGPSVELHAGKFAPRVAILFDAGKEGPALAEKIRVTVDGPEAVWPRIEESNGLVVLSGFVGVQISARERPADALANNKAFIDAMSKTVKGPLAAAAYVDLERGAREVGMLVEWLAIDGDRDRWKASVEALGVGTGIKRIAWGAGFDGPAWAAGVFVESPAPRARLAKVLFDAPPISQEILSAIPKSATMVWAGHLDLGAALTEGRAATRRVDEFAAEDFENRLDIFRGGTGVDLQKDLADVFGDEWAAYADPATGGQGLTGLVIVKRLRDAARVNKSLESVEVEFNALMRAIAPGGRAPLEMRQVARDGVTLHALSMPAISPTWAIKDGFLIVAAYPQVVLAAAEQIKRKDGGIMANDQFVVTIKRLGSGAIGQQGGPTCVYFIDVPRIVREGYGDLLMGCQAWVGALDWLGGDAPAVVVPPPDELLKHLEPAGGAGVVDRDGWHLKTTAAAPFGEVFGLRAGGGPAGAWGQVVAAWAAVTARR